MKRKDGSTTGRTEGMTAAPGPRAVVEARVLAGGVETRYLRAGRGRSVVLLMDRRADGPRADRVFEGLAREVSVVRPELPGAVWRSGLEPSAVTGPPGPGSTGPARMDPARWLRDLLDGLGLDRPAVVVDRPLAAALAELAQGPDERIGTWVVLEPGLPIDLSSIVAALASAGT